MTRAEAIEYFMIHAVTAGINEGINIDYSETSEEEWCELHTFYEDCVRWLLGLPRSYQPEFSRE